VKKVLVIGSPGSGKSVFSSRLGKITGLPVIHLDRLYWRPGWIEPTKDIWRPQLEGLLSRDSWIIDGNYSGTMDVRLEHCDTVIFLDLPRHLCTWRVFKRFLDHRGGQSRADMADGCPEKLDLAFLRWTWRYPERSRPSVMQRLERLNGKITIVRLRINREVDDFLLSLESKRADENGN
jgi:adenylate kinase family enzyme